MLYALYCAISLASAFELSCECSSRKLGDSSCDKECMTPACNFDSKLEEYDKFEILKFSDCMSDCTSECAFTKLGNGVCDLECNSEVCGFDLGDCGVCRSGCTAGLLGNGVCDQECSYKECKYDLNDCGWCAEGCFYEFLDNGVCNDRCFNHNCSYDSPDCDNRLCGPRCFPESIGNSNCNQECLTSECNYDSGDCDCSPECNYELRYSETCKPECNTESCDYQDWKCIEDIGEVCNSGCSYSMIGDGNCDEKCYNQACEYDYTDCGCAPGCSDDVCSEKCMDIRCDYTYPSLIGENSCPNLNYTLYNFQYQMITSSFESRFSLEECLAADASCDEKTMIDAMNGICTHNKCMVSECLYQVFACSKTYECPPECEECDPNGNCIKCSKDKVQMLTHCLEECPYGFKEMYVSMIDRFVCYYSDDTTPAKPHQIFVKPRSVTDVENDSSYGRGSASDPFTSLSYALMSINSKFTTLYLLDGYHDLIESESESDNTLIIDVADPLKRRYGISYSQIIITTALCTDFPDIEGCAKSRAVIRPISRVTLTLNARKFLIENVDFDGVKLVCAYNGCDCEVKTCQYCPSLYYITDGAFTDKNEFIDLETIKSQYSKGCENFSRFKFIRSIESSDILLKNVDFKSFTYQVSSLIFVYNSNLVMNDVNFSWIIVSGYSDSAVINISGSVTKFMKFKYQTGSVRYLNDGYELSKDAAFNGFLNCNSILSCELRDIKFYHNLVHIGSLAKSETGIGSLIYGYSIRNKASLEKVEFKYNYIYSCLVYIDNSYVQYTSLDLRSKSNYFSYFDEDQFRVKDIDISHCTFRGRAISYRIILTALNISIHNITITHSAAIGYESSFIDIYGLYEPNDLDTDGGSYTVKAISPYEIYFPKRYARISHLSISSCYTANNMISIDGYPNVKLEDILIADNNSNDFRSKSLVDSLTIEGFREEGLYIKSGFYEDYEIQNKIIMYIAYNKGFELIRSRFYNNSFNQSVFNLFSNYRFLTIRDSSFSDTIRDSEQALILNIIGRTDIILTIEGCYFRDIINDMGFGSILIERISEVSIINTQFYNIQSRDSGAIRISSVYRLFVHGCAFIHTESYLGSGASIELHLAYNPDFINEIKVNNSTFETCYSTSGVGCIYISSLSHSSSIILDMEHLSFVNCKSEIGSALYISQSIIFSSGSIQSVTVSSNYNSLGAPISTRHFKGALNISNINFSSSSGHICGILGLFETDGNLLNLSYMTASNNKCSGSVITIASSLLKPVVKTEYLKIESNSSLALDISNTIMFDSYSNYINNEGAFYIARGSSVKFNAVKFVRNVSYKSAGGIYITNNSMFKCKDCEFKANLGFNGGAILSEQNSKFTIENCVFDSNEASSGSVIYILVSNQESYILDSKIINNMSQNTLISIRSGSLTLTSTSFTNNDSSLYANDSKLKIINCKFQSSK
jgi:hypothetical protein